MSQEQGYIYAVYGDLKYLKHAVASAYTLRRYDKKRPIALVCEGQHRDELRKKGIDDLFTDYILIHEDHRSIVGFKHNLHLYKKYDQSIFLDSDIVWCKDPDLMWEKLKPYPFTITGNLKADPFFGARKSWGVLLDILMRKRHQTLKHFNLTYLPRVQSGFVFAKDPNLTKQIGVKASEFLNRIKETHFVSRLKEKGRNEESCEWSLAMSMSHFSVPVYSWLDGLNSIQLDFIEEFTEYDADFLNVKCRFYSDSLIYSLRGIRNKSIMTTLLKIGTYLPGKGDYYLVTPYCLHFGWFHEKKPFYEFSDRLFEQLTKDQTLISN